MTSTQSQRCTTSCTTVSPAPFTQELLESDREREERSEDHLSEEDTTQKRELTLLLLPPEQTKHIGVEVGL